MNRDFTQIVWNESVAQACRRLVQCARREDLGEGNGRDLTSEALVDTGTTGRAAIVAREDCVVAGLPAAELALTEYGGDARFAARVQDGDHVAANTALAEIEGTARTLLAAERVMLNLLGRLCGVATLTRRYVDAIAGTNARIYDTRKTTPGWRLLEKYAVGCGGGRNHRTGLFDALLIKDNHLALGGTSRGSASFTPKVAVEKAREYLSSGGLSDRAIVEIEVDTLAQFAAVLSHQPDIILLDNMTPDQLRRAVTLRDDSQSDVHLEASGGITLDNVRQIAQSGVERISIGALTHAARGIDVGLDWLE